MAHTIFFIVFFFIKVTAKDINCPKTIVCKLKMPLEAILFQRITLAKMFFSFSPFFLIFFCLSCTLQDQKHFLAFFIHFGSLSDSFDSYLSAVTFDNTIFHSFKLSIWLEILKWIRLLKLCSPGPPNNAQR